MCVRTGLRAPISASIMKTATLRMTTHCTTLNRRSITASEAPANPPLPRPGLA